ncbi:hypothetical protein KSS87_015556 [Heliosperma pusillum]|nr:hypothetical protein KSS87_015556 [Heliosperma pusillum]
MLLFPLLLDAVKKSLYSLLTRTHNFVNQVTAPLVKTGKPDSDDDDVSCDIEDIYVGEQTIPSEMPSGKLSLAAIASIEQFSRMNGLTGQKMQKLFQSLVPQSVYKDARYLVEYCCFRYLARDNSDIHPCLQDLAFQRLIFITMLGWENPYKQIDWSHNGFEEASLKTRLVGEEAFVRVAPAVSGVADRATVHNLYKALAGSKEGISFSVWSSYIQGLLIVHNERKSYRIHEHPQLLSERVLCVGSSRKQPVLKWDNNIAFPGKLILTDKALYFEPVDFSKNKRVMRLDITGRGAQATKTKVGLFGAMLFDSAVSISSGEEEIPSTCSKSALVPLSNYRGIKVMSRTMKLWERVIKQRLRRKGIYEGATKSTRTNVGKTKELPITIRVNQGSLPSPLVFAIVMDKLTGSIQEKVPWCMMFADKIVLIDETKGGVERKSDLWRHMLESLAQLECRFSGNGSTEVGSISLDGEIVYGSDFYRYLGSIIQSDGELDGDVANRIQAGWLK